jgi:SAM-dependent methyltransferase
MQASPAARAEEFMQAVQRLAVQPQMRVADVPAGGGYLQAYLPEGCQWLVHEPCADFFRSGEAATCGLLPLPWADADIDTAISIAGVHHLQDKQAFYRELWRVVRPGGQLVLADVWQGSAVALFLDGFIGAHNSTGHHGYYLNTGTAGELSEAGWQVCSVERMPLRGCFATEDELARFCCTLFDLRGVTLDQVLAAVRASLGIEQLADGVCLHWELAYCTATRGSGP